MYNILNIIYIQRNSEVCERYIYLYRYVCIYISPICDICESLNISPFSYLWAL